MQYDLFISHSSEDSLLAHSIQETLEKGLNITSFVAKNNINVGTLWPNELKHAIVNCPVAIVLVTTNSVNSPWVHAEIGARMTRDSTLIPIYFPPLTIDTPVVPTLYNRQGFNWTNKSGRLNFARSLAEHFPRSKMDESIFEQIDSGHIEPPNNPSLLLSQISEKFHQVFLPPPPTGNSPMDVFIRHLLKQCEKLTDVVNKAASDRRTIPLDNDARMAAATELVSHASHSLQAISVLDIDNWWKKGNYTRYLRENFNAASRGVDCKRIIIVDNYDTLNAIELKANLSLQAASGIQLAWIDSKSAIEIDPSGPRNILIVDSAAMTRSRQKSSDGQFVLGRGRIDKESQLFERLWARCELKGTLLEN